MSKPIRTTDRREFLKDAAMVSSSAVLLGVAACKTAATPAPETAAKQAAASETEGAKEAMVAKATEFFAGPDAPPTAKSANWDAVQYNIARGKLGYIPSAYMAQILATDGIKNQLGKHLPYVPALSPSIQKEGYLPVMWGDPQLGYAQHPNGPKAADNPEGHWYNWIRITKEGDAGSLVETRFDNWPTVSSEVNGLYKPLSGKDVTLDGGRNTVYLAELPPGLQDGDTVMVWAHCLTHGEYVDFVTLPAGSVQYAD
jgi:hypothetical protein